MRFKLGNGLIPINLLGWVLIGVVVFIPSDIFRIILGVPFLLFSPGYALLGALFVKNWGLSGVERIALSFGLSIILVPLIGFILNYTPWGIRLEPVMYSVASFILLVSIVAWIRQRRLNKYERFNISFRVVLPGGQGIWSKVITVVLIMAIVGTLGTLIYVMAAPKAGEVFTEFYILGPEGQAASYPQAQGGSSTTTVY